LWRGRSGKTGSGSGSLFHDRKLRHGSNHRTRRYVHVRQPAHRGGPRVDRRRRAWVDHAAGRDRDPHRPVAAGVVGDVGTGHGAEDVVHGRQRRRAHAVVRTVELGARAGEVDVELRARHRDRGGDGCRYQRAVAKTGDGERDEGERRGGVGTAGVGSDASGAVVVAGAADLLADRDLVAVSRLFPVWCLLSLALPITSGRLTKSFRSPGISAGPRGCGSISISRERARTRTRRATPSRKSFSPANTKSCGAGSCNAVDAALSRRAGCELTPLSRFAQRSGYRRTLAKIPHRLPTGRRISSPCQSGWATPSR